MHFENLKTFNGKLDCQEFEKSVRNFRIIFQSFKLDENIKDLSQELILYYHK